MFRREGRGLFRCLHITGRDQNRDQDATRTMTGLVRVQRVPVATEARDKNRSFGYPPPLPPSLPRTKYLSSAALS